MSNVAENSHLESDELTQQFVKELWQIFLGRLPDDKALAYLSSRLTTRQSLMDYFFEVKFCPEAMERLADINAVAPLYVPPGHFYSPVVNPSRVKKSLLDRSFDEPLPGVNLNMEAMQTLFEQLRQYDSSVNFSNQSTETSRYFADNGWYSSGDAIIQACMIQNFRPKRYIEVGSGFSSAVVLDTLDGNPDLQTRCTFIEPNPAHRLDSLLRSLDRERVEIICSDIQSVPVELYDSLGAGDILFIDSTHISKTGSDVNHELFNILPRLARGVLIHFHDIFQRFEYPDKWIFEENRSWNEQYLIHAFLMYNQDFEIVYAQNTFLTAKHDLVRDLWPRLLEEGGCSLWLRRC